MARTEPQGRISGTLQVALGERSYPIVLGLHTLPQAGAEIVRHTKASRAVIVTVPPVGRRYAAKLTRSLRDAGMHVSRVEVPDGDASKSLSRLAKLYDALLDANADRGTCIVALGGGMVGDLAGFLAATYLRGVPFVQVPTTVLAMVDASIGGKVAVNLPRGKNLVGAFHQPRLVWIDAATLKSLPRRQRAAGVAEIIKAAAIWDADLFERLERDLERVLDLEPEALLPVLQRACEIKAEVVSRDEREADLRMRLNYGHTLAHAIETLKRYRGILHGEAVSIGMVFAARRSEALGLAPAGTADRLAALLERAELPIHPPEFPRRAYLSALRVDKKKRDAHIQFVVLRGIGRSDTVAQSPAELLPPGIGRAPRRRKR